MPNDEVWVANGTYYPDGGYEPSGGSHTHGSQDRASSFNLIDDVGIYGGFEGNDSVAYLGGETLRSQRNSDPTTNDANLSGDIDGNDGPDITGTNSIHVVVANGTNETAVIDGFTITGGRANGSDDEQGGGGVYIRDNSSPMGICITSEGVAVAGVTRRRGLPRPAYWVRGPVRG